MIAPGQALLRVHMMICCPGSTSLPRGKFIIIWSLQIYPNAFSFYTDCYREWILNTFTYFWCFLELFIGKFIPNIKNEHAQDCSCPGATFAFSSHGEKLPRQGGLPGVGQRVTRLSKWSCPGATKNSCEQLQVSDRAPRQSWPRGQWVATGQWVVPGSCEQALRLIFGGVHLKLSNCSVEEDFGLQLGWGTSRREVQSQERSRTYFLVDIHILLHTASTICLHSQNCYNRI